MRTTHAACSAGSTDLDALKGDAATPGTAAAATGAPVAAPPPPGPVIPGPSANDNGAPGVPGPAVARSRSERTRVWDQRDPHVAGLIAGLTAARAPALGAVAQTLDYLISRAQADGRVSGANGVATYRAISAASGIGLGHFNIGRPARLALDRWLPAFDVESVPGMRGDRSPTTGLTERVRLYVEGLVRDGRPMPATPNGAQVSVVAVAREMDVSPERLDACLPALRLLRDAVATGGVGLAASPDARRRTPTELSERIGELMAVVRSFDVPGGRLPESPHHVGAPDYERIAELTGTAGPSLRRNARYRRLVGEVVARRGTAPPGLMGREDTFAALLAWGTERVEAAQKAKGSVTWAAVVANHRSALDRFAASLGLTGEDDAEAAFGGAFDANLARASEGVGTPASTSNFVRLVRRWRELRLQRLAAVDLPERFGPALRQLLQLRGMTASALAREVNCDHHTICDWCSEQLGVTAARVPLVGRIEAVLKLEPGMLLSKVSEVRINYGPFEGATADYLALDVAIRRLLPLGAAHWDEVELAAAVLKVSPLLGTGTAHGALCRQARLDGSFLAPFRPTTRLQAQFDEFVRYKSVPVPYPLLRASRAQWMSDETVEMRSRQVVTSLRFAPTPLGDGPWSGLGVDPALATMAWFAVPVFPLAFSGQRARRFAHMEWRGERRGVFYTSAEVDFLSLCVSMTNPVTGWLTQHPELAGTLVPIGQRLPRQFDDLLQMYADGGPRALVTEEDVAEARRDWVGFCERAHRHYVQARERVNAVARISRNPYESISGLIRAAEPIPDYLALLYASERAWASERTSPASYRLDVRDSAMNRLAPLTGFRPGNLAGLVYTGDERGEIRKVDGVWEIEVDYLKFKNWRSCRLFSTRTAPKNFRMQLRDECGLYDVLDTWFQHARAYVVREPGQGSAFVTRSGTPMTPKDYNDALGSFAVRHVAWNPVKGTGYPGVTSLNPYQIRHLRASDTLKRSKALNRVEEAAFAIQTSEQMIVSSYGFMVPEQAILEGYDTFSEGARKAWKRFEA